MWRPALLMLACCSLPVLAQSSAAATEESVALVAGKDTLSGTLTLPASSTRVPAVMLLSGAGADDRDASVGRFRPFKILADTLASLGFAVLRYDDRGTGTSGGRHPWQYQISEHQEEVRAGLARLRAHPRIDPSRIALVGHSYGTVMASLASASDTGIRGLVLLSPARGLLQSQMDFQIARALARGRTMAQARELARFESTTVAPAARTGAGWDAVRAEMRRRAAEEYGTLPDSARARYPTFDRFFATTVDSFTLSWAAAGHPFFRDYWSYDILATARRVTAPVLMIWGEADQQTPPQANQGPLEAAYREAGSRDVSSHVIAAANHYLQNRLSPPDQFAPSVTSIVATWLLTRVAARR